MSPAKHKPEEESEKQRTSIYVDPENLAWLRWRRDNRGQSLTWTLNSALREAREADKDYKGGK